jgi:hypothetical protein
MSGNIEPQRVYVYDLKTIDLLLIILDELLSQSQKDKIIFDGNLITNATTKKEPPIKIRII